MTENEKMEQFYGILYEFDSNVQAMVEMLKMVEMEKLPHEHQSLLNHYNMLLQELLKTYTEIDKRL